MAGKLNITDILDKYPYQVSGGQKTAVCLCQSYYQPAKVDPGGRTYRRVR